jgi:uncharacterized protein DUF1688
MNVDFVHIDLMTGLPEYRNGGLLIDTGLLTLKDSDRDRGIAAFHRHRESAGKPSIEVVPAFEPHDDVIVEWRAVTVCFLDEIHRRVCEELDVRLSLAQVLEAGTWKVSSIFRLLAVKIEFSCTYLQLLYSCRKKRSLTLETFRVEEKSRPSQDQTLKNHPL